jgi:molybdopterin molybdotransferase
MRLAVDAARKVMQAGPATTSSEVAPLREALGRTLAEPLIAPRDQPPAPASAMDGFAFGPGDSSRRRIVGESRAGRPFRGAVHAGEAVLISTGAEVPPDCPLVVTKENALVRGRHVWIKTPEPNFHVREKGSDFETGDVLLERGRRLRGGEIALAASAGFSEVVVSHRPRVTILCTGDELLTPGAPAEPGKIYNSNGVMLASLIQEAGGSAFETPPIPDTIEDIARAAEAAEGEVVVLVGGASVGVHDHCRVALDRLGLKIDVPGLSMKPGKPFWSGLLPDGRRVVGLPGNPVSAFVCAHLFLSPLLARLQGAPADEFVQVAIPRPPSPSESERWLLATIEPAVDGTTAARLVGRDSASTRPLAAAQLIVRIPAGEAQSPLSKAIRL